MKKLIESIPITSDSVVIDIGSNEGQEIDALLSIGCEIHSFEPHPMFAKELKVRYGKIPNVHLNQCAAWTSNCEQTLYFKRDALSRNGGASMLKFKSNVTHRQGEHYSKKVKCVDIAQYIKDLNTAIDLLKIDAEGVEYDLLDHIFNTGAHKKIKHFYYEDHSQDFALQIDNPREKHVDFSISGPPIEAIVRWMNQQDPELASWLARDIGPPNPQTLEWHKTKDKVLSKYKKANITLNTWHG